MAKHKTKPAPVEHHAPPMAPTLPPPLPPETTTNVRDPGYEDDAFDGHDELDPDTHGLRSTDEPASALTESSSISAMEESELVEVLNSQKRPIVLTDDERELCALIRRCERQARGHGADLDRELLLVCAIWFRADLGLSASDPLPDLPAPSYAPTVNAPAIGHSLPTDSQR